MASGADLFNIVCGFQVHTPGSEVRPGLSSQGKKQEVDEAFKIWGEAVGLKGNPQVGTVAHTCHSRPWEPEAKDCKFQASLGYKVGLGSNKRERGNL